MKKIPVAGAVGPGFYNADNQRPHLDYEAKDLTCPEPADLPSKPDEVEV